MCPRNIWRAWENPEVFLVKCAVSCTRGGGSRYGTLEQAKAKCKAEPTCRTLHDMGADHRNWRACSGTMAAGTGSNAAATYTIWRVNGAPSDTFEKRVQTR
eukprot:gene56597-biopygen14933